MDIDRRETDKHVEKTVARSVESLDYQELPVALAVMAKRFPDGYFVEPHDHPRDQLIYAVAGLMRVATSDDTWVVPPDRALFMPADIEHSIEICGNVEMRSLYITPLKASTIKVLKVHSLLRELITHLGREPIDYSGNKRAEQIAALIRIELIEAEALPLNIPLPRDERLRRVCQRLMNDPSTTLPLEQLADDAGASSKTLARLCARELGMSFSAWRRRVRFSKAMELLDGGQPTKQVARSCGYDSPSAFTYAFRKEFGVPPSGFRK
ncbi:helix-turn-helix domain-containing protein [Leisingera sp. M523]|uniref:AraC family transcriptional regulator n=1 Tax=Leisingera sp. M523 TaxID=2867013 RepID=UPI0021A2EF4B|nr:helix-turn-helix transcriptional regulator [Leisingera sp. M523]UWQ29250.1 helix-turn-helix transcriptional regulator [Leisingera sp. M523]